MKKIITLLCLALLLTSCATVSYMTDNLVDVDIPNFRTYSTEDHCEDQDINPIMLQRVKNAIDISMRNRSVVRSKNPDMIVQYFIKNEMKNYYSTCRIDYNRWEGGEDCRNKVITYEEGSIVIDFVDTNTNTIVWHGAIKGPSFNYMKDPDTKINNMVSNLLEHFFDKKEVIVAQN